MFLLVTLICVVIAAWYLFANKAKKKIPAQGVVLISGASAGIGRQTALHLAAKGFSVIAGVRKDEDGKELQKESQSTNGGSLKYVLLDVTNQESIDKAFEFVSSVAGEKGLYGLVNNAGVVGSFGPVEHLDVEEWKYIFDVNYFGNIRMTQKFLPLMRKHGSARLINTSSPNSIVHVPFLAPYSSTKAAVTVLNGIMRQELKEQNIKTILLVPSNLRSRLVDSFEATFNEWAETVGAKLANYSSVLNIVKKFIKSTHGEKALQPVQLAADIVYDALTDETPSCKYTCGNGPPSIVAILPANLTDWLLTKI